MKCDPEADSAAAPILIVEDSPTQAQHLEHLLEEHGFNVAMAANGREALALLEELKPKVVISDIMMPEMDGFTLCREIKAKEKFAGIQVVLLTSLSSPHDVIQGLQCGADNFIRKPYEGSYLISRVSHLLTSREQQKSEKIWEGLKIRFQGQEYLITSERQQVLDLLMSTFEEAVRLNEDLMARERDLAAANKTLEREIVERKRAEAEARKLNNELTAANKELESFSYSVSHDLRAPLRRIVSFSEIIQRDCADMLDARGKHCLEVVNTCGNHMGELIDGLLNLSRMTRQEIRLETVDLSALAQSIVEEIRQDEPDRQVQFVIAQGVRGSADRRLMRAVLENLVRNAWKFTAKQPNARIEFDADPKADSPTYFVRDNGAGFDMEYAGKLFQPFQRLHSEAEFPGTGIGLATVQRIMYRHGGRIWAEGIEGAGATFFFSLPG